MKNSLTLLLSLFILLSTSTISSPLLSKQRNATDERTDRYTTLSEDDDDSVSNAALHTIDTDIQENTHNTSSSSDALKLETHGAMLLAGIVMVGAVVRHRRKK